MAKKQANKTQHVVNKNHSVILASVGCGLKKGRLIDLVQDISLVLGGLVGVIKFMDEIRTVEYVENKNDYSETGNSPVRAGFKPGGKGKKKDVRSSVGARGSERVIFQIRGDKEDHG